ncbi:MAG: hypothetical protein IKU55_05815, partial [Clostridia bacterium]|nr:hypothetical protein [Clostridia bacterium]
RDFRIFDENGDDAVVGATFSSLLDVKKHRLCMDRALLANFRDISGEVLLEAEHRLRESFEFVPQETRKVRASWLDGLGHVNNMRYAELAYDALLPTEREKIDAFRRMDVYFLRELTEDAVFTVEKAATDDAIVLRGVIDADGKPSFLVKLTT